MYILLLFILYFYCTMRNGMECKWKDTDAKTKNISDNC